MPSSRYVTIYLVDHAAVVLAAVDPRCGACHTSSLSVSASSLPRPPRNESTPDVTPLMTKPATYDEFSSRKSLDTTVFFSRPRFSVVGHIIISEGPGSRSPMLIDFC